MAGIGSGGGSGTGPGRHGATRCRREGMDRGGGRARGHPRRAARGPGAMGRGIRRPSPRSGRPPVATPGRRATRAGTPRRRDVVAARASAPGAGGCRAEDPARVRAVASAKDAGHARGPTPFRRVAGVTRAAHSARRDRIAGAKQARGRPQIARGCGGRGPARDSRRADGRGTARRRFLPFVFHSNTRGPADVRARQRWPRARLLKFSKWKRMIFSYLYLQLDENTSCATVALR